MRNEKRWTADDAAIGNPALGDQGQDQVEQSLSKNAMIVMPSKSGGKAQTTSTSF